MPADIRFGVIGVGAWGVNHVRVVASEPGCVLAGVADIDDRVLSRAHSIASGVTCTREPAELLADPEIDAVVIATPPATHARLVCAALECNKHVLVEKPFALNVKDAMRVVDQSRRSSSIVMVGHLLVHHPAVIRLKELFQIGTLGQLHYIHATRANWGQPRSDSVLWSFGPHDLSMIELLLERSPISVSATGRGQRGLEDLVFVSLRYPGNVMAQLHLSWVSPRKERRLTLVGSERVMELDDVAHEKLRIFDRGYSQPPRFTKFDEYLALGQGDIHIPQVTMEEPLRLQLRSFLDAIRNGQPALSGPTSGLRTVVILEAAQRSLAAGGTPQSLEYPLETTSDPR